MQTAQKEKLPVKQTLKEYAWLTLATLLMAIGIAFFKFPNHFSTGGVSGISIILGHYFPGMTPGTFVFIINQLLLLLGFLVFGKSFGVRTAYVSLLMSGVIWLLERVYPLDGPLTSQPLLELIFAVALPAIGSAIMFNMQASSGGTDIVAMILKKKTNINIGQSLLFVDFAITLMAAVAFGVETGLFSILGLAVKSVIVDMVLENIAVHKYFQIITTKPEPIIDFIVKDLHRGATRMEGESAFTHEDKTVLLTAVSRAQAVRLRQFAKQVDPSCFILITNTTEIIGKGFRGVM
ncbi:MAG: YitT family protein [Clostridia bacterium]|nr:YitT family protein [Clostridia bacterium]